MDQLITLKEGSQIIGFQDWQTKVETEGEGKSYGVELFLQKKRGKTTGWSRLHLVLEFAESSRM